MIVPTKAKTAAKRAFIRTTAQAYAATIPAGGISAAVLASAIKDPQPVQLVATGIAWLLAPLCAGATAYLSMLSKGIPADYQDDVDSVLE